VTHHAEGLSRLTHDPELVAAVKTDYRTADLSDADTAMLDFAVKLTRAPCGCERDDVGTLRAHGFTDTDVLDIVQVVGYYAYVNRLACGLGVELEPYWKDGDDEAE
jgi:uncharacterized peroxidase-related enzyme